NAQVGGWCRSLEVNGFTFDFAGHIMFSNDPYVHEMYARLLGDNVHWQDREAWIYSKGVYTRYPFQGSLYGLPPEVIRECIVGAVTARFEATSPPTPARRADGAATRAVNGNGRAAYKAAGLAERLDRAEAGLSRSGGSAGEPRAGCQRRAAGGPAGLERARDDGGAIEDCCADGLLESTARLAPAGGDQTNARGNGRGAGEPANF